MTNEATPTTKVCPCVNPELNPSRTTRHVGALIALTLLAYANAFLVPFLFDDQTAIVENPTIRSLAAPGSVLSPPFANGETVGGRPLLNLSFALNYAFGGTSAAGYHAVNLAIHLAAGLVLLGLMRRHPRFGGCGVSPQGKTSYRPDTDATFAFAVALLWLLHPLQTEAVTYLSQRAESLAALFYLLTLYGFARAVAEPSRGNTWLFLSFASCLCGMATKEVMVSAPLIVLLYDRTFVTGTFRAAWRTRARFYLALASTWLLLAWLVAGAHGRGGTAGADTGPTPWTYALTQCEALARYASLAGWPHPLIFDYGRETIAELTRVALPAGAILTTLALVIFALCRWPRAGFCGALFFCVLAPSSSFVPIATQTMAEHRMYLPLAAIIVLSVAGIHRAIGARARSALFAGALPLALLTSHRNHDYRSPLALWSDTAAKHPANARAHNNVAIAALEAGDTATAIRHAESALRRDPAFAEAHNNLAVALAAAGRRAEATAHLSEALRLRPHYAEAQTNLGKTLMANRAPVDEVLACFRRALELDSRFAEAHNQLGLVLCENGRAAEGLTHAERATALAPDSAGAQNTLGIAFARNNRLEDSLAAFARAAALAPHAPDIQENWSKVLAIAGRRVEAAEHAALAARLRGGSKR